MLEVVNTLGVPVGLCVLAIVALWARNGKSDAALLAAHAERIVKLEARADTCERERAALASALQSEIRRRPRRK